MQSVFFMIRIARCNSHSQSVALPGHCNHGRFTKMDFDEEDVLVLYAWWNCRRKKKSSRRWYVRPLNRSRTSRGEFHSLVGDMRRLEDDEVFLRYFRMSPHRFDDLLRRISPLISHQGTHRSPVSAAERLSVTLRILATGNSQQSVADSYRLGKSTVNDILLETCKALWTALKDEYLAIPTVDEWRAIGADSWRYWNFPMCLGSVDGKHVAIKAPPNSGSDYFNYKKFNSIILLAAVDAKYKFTLVDIGAYGRESDGGVFSRSGFGTQLEDGTLPIPGPACLPGSDVEVPYVFVGDEAFPLKKYLMRPYAGK